MAISGFGPRLMVSEQFSRNIDFRGRQLAVNVIAPKGFETRAVDVVGNLQDLLATEGVDIRFITPMGNKLIPAQLVGMNPGEIDNLAARVDALSKTSLLRYPLLDL